MSDFFDDEDVVEPSQAAAGSFFDDDDVVEDSAPVSIEEIAPGAPKDEPNGFSDLMAGIREGLPGYGLMQKAGAATNAGLDQLVDVFSERPDKTFGEHYDTWREHQKGEDAARAERSPVLNTTGNVAGSLLAPSGGATRLGRIGVNAGLASVDMATRQDSVKDAASEGGKAGGIAGGLTAAGEAISPLFGKLSRAAKAGANARAVKSLDPILSQQEALARKGVVHDLGSELLDSGTVRFGSSVKDMAPRLEDLLASKGRKIGEIRDAADEGIAREGLESAGVDLNRILRKGQAQEAFSDASNLATQKQSKAYRQNAESLARSPHRTVAETQQEITSLGNQVPWNKPFADWKPGQRAAADLRRDLVGQVDDRVRRFAPDRADEYGKLKEQFGMFKDADAILDKSVARQARNADFGLRDLLVANAARGSQGAAGAAQSIAGAVATKLARERGNASLAVTLDKASQILAGNPEALGKFAAPLAKAAQRGNKSLMATHLMLMEDPEYRALVEDQEEAK